MKNTQFEHTKVSIIKEMENNGSLAKACGYDILNCVLSFRGNNEKILGLTGFNTLKLWMDE